MELAKAGFVPASRHELLVAAVKKLHSYKRGDSMRSAARLTMGYYPLPAIWLSSNGPTRADVRQIRSF